MPRYPVTTNLSPKEFLKLEETCKIEGKTRYAIARTAILEYCEACIEGSKLNVGKESIRENTGEDRQLREDID